MKLLQCRHSNHECYGFIFTLFLLFFTYFVAIFYIFPEVANHICEQKQWQRHFISFFHVFIIPRYTFETGMRSYICIPNNVSGFFGEN